MLLDVCAYHRVKLSVILHQGIVLIIEAIKDLLFISLCKPFIRSVPDGLQPVTAGGVLGVGTFHHISDPGRAELGKGFPGTFRAFAAGIVILLVEAAVDDLGMKLDGAHYAVKHLAFHVSGQLAVNVFSAELVGGQTPYLFFGYPFGTPYPEQFLYPVYHPAVFLVDQAGQG